MANPTTPNKDRPGQTGASTFEKAKDAVADTAHNVAEKVGEAASTVGHKAGELASNVGKKADSAVSSAGRGMESFADTVRDHGPQSGMMGKATSAVADTLDSAGEYLESHGLSGIGEDLTNMVRRNPIPALLIGIGVGYLLARATRS